MQARWHEWVYPQLRLLSAADRAGALRRARREALDAFELIGIAAGLILATVILRAALWDNPSPGPRDLLLSFAVACLAILPFFVRRTRRALRRIVASRSPPIP